MGLLHRAGEPIHLCCRADPLALYGEFEPVSTLVICGAMVLFFLLAVLGYNPQRGMIRRTPQAHPA
jgi:hypothetical protein